MTSWWWWIFRFFCISCVIYCSTDIPTWTSQVLNDNTFFGIRFVIFLSFFSSLFFDWKETCRRNLSKTMSQNHTMKYGSIARRKKMKWNEIKSIRWFRSLVGNVCDLLFFFDIATHIDLSYNEQIKFVSSWDMYTFARIIIIIESSVFAANWARMTLTLTSNIPFAVVICWARRVFNFSSYWTCSHWLHSISMEKNRDSICNHALKIHVNIFCAFFCTIQSAECSMIFGYRYLCDVFV